MAGRTAAGPRLLDVVGLEICVVRADHAVLFQFGTAFILLRTNRWQRQFFDAIEQREADQLVPLMIIFLGIMAMQVLMIMTENFVDGLLSIRWRTYLTRDYLNRWMSRNRYAEIERLRIIDNPDQRIADDLNAITAALGMTVGALHIVMRLIGSIVTGITFAMVLLETAPPIRVSLGGMAFRSPEARSGTPSLMRSSVLT